MRLISKMSTTGTHFLCLFVKVDLYLTAEQVLFFEDCTREQFERVRT